VSASAPSSVVGAAVSAGVGAAEVTATSDAVVVGAASATGARDAGRPLSVAGADGIGMAEPVRNDPESSGETSAWVTSSSGISTTAVVPPYADSLSRTRTPWRSVSRLTT
jgi:hypothetical protein